jgi:hypothetical protein
MTQTSDQLFTKTSLFSVSSSAGQNIEKLINDFEFSYDGGINLFWFPFPCASSGQEPKAILIMIQVEKQV